MSVKINLGRAPSASERFAVSATSTTKWYHAEDPVLDLCGGQMAGYLDRAMTLQNPRDRALLRSTQFIFAMLAVFLTAAAQQTASPKPASPPSMSWMTEAQLRMVERQFVAAAEAMPDDKYTFAPAGVEFSGVRTFALEVRHVATANFVIYSAILGQVPPSNVTVDGAANGPDNLQTKEQI